MKRHYPVIVEQDKDGVFIVECPSLKSCRSYGLTIYEALENIQEAIEVCLMEEMATANEQLRFVGIRNIEMAIP